MYTLGHMPRKKASCFSSSCFLFICLRGQGDVINEGTENL